MTYLCFRTSKDHCVDVGAYFGPSFSGIIIRWIYLLVFLCISSLGLGACSSYPTSTVSNHVDTVYVIDSTMHPAGTLSGWVTMYSLYYQPPPYHFESPAEGTSVGIDGTSYSTVADTNGHWTIDNLPPGNYTLTFHNPRCRDYKIFNQQVAAEGGSLVEFPVILAETITRASVTNLNARLATNGADYINVLYSFVPVYNSYAAARIFIGRDSTVSSRPDSYLYTVTGPPHTDNSLDDIRFWDLYRAGFKHGDTMYITVWSCLNVSGAAYWDPILNQLVDPTANPAGSAIVRLVLP